MISSIHSEKIAEWFNYAEKFMSRDLVLNAKMGNPVFSIGYVQNADSKPPLPVNKVIGNIVFFDHLPSSEFHPFKSIAEKANSEALNKNKALLGGNNFDESITSVLGGRGIRAGGVNQNDYLLTLTFHLIPNDEEYLQLFQSRQMMSGGAEEAIVKYWNDRYGMINEEELDSKITDLLAKNDAIVTRAGLKAKYHELASKRF